MNGEFNFGDLPTSSPFDFSGSQGGGLRDREMPWSIGGRSGSWVHYSPENGVHADLGEAPFKQHISFSGQTTLQTFGVGDGPSLQNDINLANLGGVFRGW